MGSEDVPACGVDLVRELNRFKNEEHRTKSNMVAIIERDMQ